MSGESQIIPKDYAEAVRAQIDNGLGNFTDARTRLSKQPAQRVTKGEHVIPTEGVQGTGWPRRSYASIGSYITQISDLNKRVGFQRKELRRLNRALRDAHLTEKQLQDALHWERKRRISAVEAVGSLQDQVDALEYSRDTRSAAVDAGVLALQPKAQSKFWQAYQDSAFKAVKE